MPQQTLPPGPREPRWVQTIHWQTRPIAFLERNRAKFGKRWTTQLVATPPFVMLTDPDEIKQVFTAPPDVLHPGEGARILEPVLGKHSVILLDEGDHLSQRKLMLPAFHGEKMERLESLMREVSEREVESWELGEPIELHKRFQALTLEVILRAVFGLDPGPRLDTLRQRLTVMAENAVKPFSAVPQLQKDWNPLWRQFTEIRAEVDRHLFELIDERRAEGDSGRADILTMLLEAQHEDGSPMSHQELRDELMTLLVAGHETTASELSWAFERLAREPRVVDRLVEEIDSGNGDKYVTATVHETLRRRPVLPNAAPRLVKKPIEVGGIEYPEGVCLVANGYLLHHDPEVYEDPYEFRPERFLDEKPGTYTWIPFGGGRRRCLGASFALLEMNIVLKAVFERAVPRPGVDGPELTRRRAITVAPKRGAQTILVERLLRAQGVEHAQPSAAASGSNGADDADGRRQHQERDDLAAR